MLKTLLAYILCCHDSIHLLAAEEMQISHSDVLWLNVAVWYSGNWTLIDKNCNSVFDPVTKSKAVYLYILKDLSFGSKYLI